jgi:predicted RNA-binding Zn-ribbon protein involved in translation (DUF1610 family)
MAASLSVPSHDRWAFAIVAAVGLLGVLIFSSTINARLLKDSEMKCPNCKVIFFEQRSDVVMASGNCPECGFQVITEPGAGVPAMAASTSRSISNPQSNGAQ